MPKHTTGGPGSTGEPTTCELCGEVTETLEGASVAGAQLAVCPACTIHNDVSPPDTDPPTQKRPTPEPDEETAQPEHNLAYGRGTSRGLESETLHWEERAGSSESDPLPQLVSNSGARVRQAREEAGLTRAEVATALDITEQDLLAIEHGDAATAGIGPTVITTLERYLAISLTE